jgi:PAS domain S-box-containing protein
MRGVIFRAENRPRSTEIFTFMATRIPNFDAIERLPWFLRFLIGCGMAAVAVGLNAAIQPLRAFPLLLFLPAVVFASWFLGMWGAAGCALLGEALIYKLVASTPLWSVSSRTTNELRLTVFAAGSLLLGWAMRRLSQQREELINHELHRKLTLAEAERKLAEERALASEQLRYRDDVLRLALQASGMGLWVWEIEKGVVHRSDEMFRIVGCEPGAFGTEPEAWLKYIHPDDVEDLKRAIEKARAEGTDYHNQYRVRTNDGSERWLESQGKCQFNSDGQVVRIVGVAADITLRKLAEEAMLRSEKLAIAGRLAATVAHEINNPLEAVANMLYLITLTETTEEAQRHAAGALDELMRISLIAQSTLKFHRQTGTPKVVLLSEVLGTVVTLFRAKMHSMDIALEVEVGSEVQIACMPSEAQQIFANLLANAIEAMPRGGRLRIRLRASRDWRNHRAEGMRVTICDSGVGIDRAMLRRIFEPFYTTKAETGTGLGLWVVAQLVERHKGRVQVWSSQRGDRGATVFSVFLPIGDVGAAEGAAENENETAAKGPRSEEPAKVFLESRKA